MKIEIKEVDNGFVLDWDELRPAEVGVWVTVDFNAKTSGREIVQTKKALRKRVKELLK